LRVPRVQLRWGAAAAAVILLQGVALATPHKVLLFSHGNSQQAANIILEILNTSPRLTVLSATAVVPLLRQADLADDSVRKASDLHEQGRQALLALDHDRAHRLLEEARQLLEHSSAWLYEPELVAQVHLLRGVVAVRAARPDLARQAFIAAHHMDPALELDAHYSPQVRSAFEQTVASAPPAPAPSAKQLARIASVVPHTNFALVITVDEIHGQPTLLKALTFEKRQKAYVEVDSEQIPSASGASGGLVQSAQALGQRLKRQLESRLLGPASRPFLAATLPTSRAIARLPYSTPVYVRTKPWYKRWYVWTTVGVVAAAAAVAIALTARDDVVDLSVSWER